MQDINRKNGHMDQCFSLMKYGVAALSTVSGLSFTAERIILTAGSRGCSIPYLVSP